ncbi:hypothetical protein F5Y00DRAFT_256594 [Daldinia vernicosa]|uniref:uncharacterized protein n=1 Tax=Daldinia vernicosa TaxID=114800 RepID=UPI002008D129|nr:uncharacterized protein F5Y00DRAFT_256594 [Daldinia vernicosa]KAI0854094.1 hypothetical protein F5Y00DRAFT_256594 [Daldinia vernicosa]
MAPSAFFGRSKNRTGLIFMASFFCLMTTIIVLSRVYARRLTRVGLGVDDWLALVALPFVLGLNGIFIAGAVEGAITGHSLINSDNKSITSDLEHTAQKYKYAFQITEKLAFGLIKLSLIFLWKRLFGPAKYFTRICWFMIAVTSGWSLSFFFATIFECGTNWTWNWAPIAIFLNQCAGTPIMLSVFTGMDLLTDLIIMFMPVPLIWGLRMPIKKKMGVTSILVLGLFTIGTGAARMYFYIISAYDVDDNPDFLSNFTLFILWSDIEANVAIVICYMPTLTPVLRSYYNGLAY